MNKLSVFLVRAVLGGDSGARGNFGQPTRSGAKTYWNLVNWVDRRGIILNLFFQSFR